MPEELLLLSASGIVSWKAAVLLKTQSLPGRFHPIGDILYMLCPQRVIRALPGGICISLRLAQHWQRVCPPARNLSSFTKKKCTVVLFDLHGLHGAEEFLREDYHFFLSLLTNACTKCAAPTFTMGFDGGVLSSGFFLELVTWGGGGFRGVFFLDSERG